MKKLSLAALAGMVGLSGFDLPEYKTPMKPINTRRVSESTKGKRHASQRKRSNRRKAKSKRKTHENKK